ncbi:MAG TPA: leishmanolysin-related zinc metalloendopeptidase [Longimicrobium sp.]|nr:leishmanolysin-related zinc metalloendopeptidase [Longimicrobium sp.]
MPSIRSLRLLPVAVLLAACADDPLGTPPPPTGPRVLGVYEVVLSAVGTPSMHASMAPVAPAAPGGPRLALNPAASGLTLETVSSASFTEGARGQGGHRYIQVTYRVRNGTGAPLSNLTFVAVSTAGTMAGTPVSTLNRFDGTAAAASLASGIVPTGAVTLGGGTTLRATETDVLQVFQESEVAAIATPAGITGVFPYGYVVRNADDPSSRTLPVAAGASDFAGLVTFAMRVPLAASSSQDVFTFAIQVLAVQDTETRMTESMEEAQDTGAVRRLRERAAAIGATTVTVLPGSSAAAAWIPDYPGQRQICTVRTAGTAALPTTTITSPAAYTRIDVMRPGESASACGAYFRGGTAVEATAGSPYTVTARAMDRYGNARTTVSDVVALERVSGPSVTGGAGTALAGGQASIQLTFGEYGISLLRAQGNRVQEEHAIQVGLLSIARNAGHEQTAMAGMPVATPPSVLVTNQLGVPQPGVSVNFSADNGGSVTGPTAVTDANGIAAVGSWTMGGTANLNTLTAVLGGAGIAGDSVTFSAAGCAGGGGSGYAITLCFTSDVTPSQRTVFENAAARWEGLITGDLASLSLTGFSAGHCGAGSPSLEMTVDDLLIFAGIEPIDGLGGILGSAGWCLARVSDFTPISGLMRFDAADVAALESSGRFSSVILHEMGHVLGIGTMWEDFWYLENKSPVGGPPLDTYFSGPQAVAGFNAIGGATYTGGQKVPVENTGPGGTINSHWRESVLDNELMTGYLDSGVDNPLSQLTVRSLADIGYTVNPAAADPFFLTLSLREGSARDQPGLLLLDDVWRGPRQQVDAQGRAVPFRPRRRGR